jgi:hypothetical protein
MTDYLYKFPDEQTAQTALADYYDAENGWQTGGEGYALDVVGVLIGETGEAITPLRPSGTARIAGKRVDVTAVGDFLESGEAIIVVAADGMRISVRRKDGLEPAPEAA